MDIFVGNLPGSASLVELQGFIGDVDLRADFQCKNGRDRHGEVYHYFIARTENREQGVELISELNGRMFEGRPVEVREYLERAPDRKWRGEERRINPEATGFD